MNILRNIGAFETVKCSSCPSSKSPLTPTLEVEVKELHNLEKVLKVALQEKLCRKLCTSDTCQQRMIRKLEIAATHLFIEPINTSHKTLEVGCFLLTIINTTYYLRGVAG